jgi:hypothetical protein
MRQIERRVFGECQPLGNYKSERPIGALITARRTREEETHLSALGGPELLKIQKNQSPAPKFLKRLL